MTNTDRPTRAELAREAFIDMLAARTCPLHDAETIVYEDLDLLLIGCPVPGCEVAPEAVGAF